MPGAKKSAKSRASKKVKASVPARSANLQSSQTPTNAPNSSSSGRRLRPARYNSLRLKKRIKHPVKLLSSWKVAKASRRLIYQHWKVIGGIVLVYGLLNMILVRGLNGGADVRQLKSEFDIFFHGTLGHLASGFSIFALLVTSSTSTSGADGSTAYQTLLFVMVGLALIWAYRQLLANYTIRIRDAYYKGMYPVIPVILVLLVMSLQLIPMLIGGWLFSTVIQNGIAITGVEKSLWGALFFLLGLLSVYMLTSSVFALYIATLPDMTPMKALRSARELVRHRRWQVMRKVLFLPLWLIVVGSIIMLPLIFVLPIAAQWVFFVLSTLAIAFGHAYMYTLYRELLREKN